MNYVQSKAEELAQLGDDLFTPRFWTRVIVPTLMVGALGVSLSYLVGSAAKGKHPYLVGTASTVRSNAVSPLEKR